MYLLLICMKTGIPRVQRGWVVERLLTWIRQIGGHFFLETEIRTDVVSHGGQPERDQGQVVNLQDQGLDQGQGLDRDGGDQGQGLDRDRGDQGQGLDRNGGDQDPDRVMKVTVRLLGNGHRLWPRLWEITMTS
jgi:hypothetical protein